MLRSITHDVSVPSILVENGDGVVVHGSLAVACVEGGPWRHNNPTGGFAYVVYLRGGSSRERCVELRLDTQFPAWHLLPPAREHNP